MPLSGSKGLGVLSVKGRKRVPKPPTNIIAVSITVRARLSLGFLKGYEKQVGFSEPPKAKAFEECEKRIATFLNEAHFKPLGRPQGRGSLDPFPNSKVKRASVSKCTALRGKLGKLSTFILFSSFLLSLNLSHLFQLSIFPIHHFEMKNNLYKGV